MKPKTKKTLIIAAAAVAIVAIVYGGLTGGAMKALQKAVAICKECIGLG